jgi:predicted nicotinamide N-methyase
MPLSKLMMLNKSSTEISGQKLWCGSLAVCEYLLSHHDHCKDKYIIELGAGTGVAGMISAKLGAGHVCLTDHDQRSLDHMLTDVADNSIPNTSVARFDWYNPDYSLFDTTLAALAINLASEGASAPVRLIAGDVIYKRLLIEPFFAVVKELLWRYSGSSLLLCHIPRAGVSHEVVQAEIARVCLALTVLHEGGGADQWMGGLVTQYSPEEDYSRAKLYLISL